MFDKIQNDPDDEIDHFKQQHITIELKIKKHMKNRIQKLYNKTG